MLFRLISKLLLIISVLEAMFAQSGREIVEKLNKKYSIVNDAIVKFEQSVRYGSSRVEQTFSGTLYFKKKNKYRIETEQQIIVTDGNTSWLYSKVNKQVIIDRYKEDRNAFLLSPDKFFLTISDEYIPIILETEKVSGKKVIVLKLTPRDSDAPIEYAKIWIVEEDLSALKVEIGDINGTITTYVVKSFKVNQGIDDSLFKFSIPSDVKVVDLR